MHPIEAEKQRQYSWWLDFFLAGNARRGDRVERYRLGIFVIAMLGTFLSGVTYAIQSYQLPIHWIGHWSALLFPWMTVLVMIHVRWRGYFRQSALYFGLIGSVLVVLHLLTLRTLYIGQFYWIPWIIVFVSLISGRWQGLLIGAAVLVLSLVVVRSNGNFGHSMGVYKNFSELFLLLVENQIFAMLAITAMMYTFALYNDRMESELERQYISRAQTAHKSMIGEMLGNLAHEVNNPLAIVHTALVHYQRLLQSNRLDQSMQRGLIDRIEDALNRLDHVVDDLNSSADWGDLEEPRSFASTQSENRRPPQFGLSNSEPDFTGRDNRRRSGWLPRLVRHLIDGLDSLLPKITRNWSTSQRFRARTTALILFIGLLAMAANVLQLYLEQAAGFMMQLGMGFLLIGVFSMLLLKLFPKPQMLGVSYIFVLFVVTWFAVSTRGHSILSPAMLWFPIMIVALFLVAQPKLALVFSLLMLAGHFFLMMDLKSFGLQISFSQTFPEYLIRLQSTLVLTTITVIVLSSAFISLMNSTHGLLVAEKDWHLLSARMRELSELADSAAILMGDPLKSLRGLAGELKLDGENLRTLEQMQLMVDRITRVSQSFTLLSQPKANEGPKVIAGQIWMEHIKNICFRRAAEAGWALSTHVEPADLQITGPLGRLTMLVITSLKEAIGRPAPEPLSPLLLTVQAEANAVLLQIRYALPIAAKPLVDSQFELEEALRLSLLDELLDSLHAILERSQDGYDRVLEIRWFS